eukprot:2181056-Amphidinium_carterae.1
MLKSCFAASELQHPGFLGCTDAILARSDNLRDGVLCGDGVVAFEMTQSTGGAISLRVNSGFACLNANSPSPVLV